MGVLDVLTNPIFLITAALLIAAIFVYLQGKAFKKGTTLTQSFTNEDVRKIIALGLFGLYGFAVVMSALYFNDSVAMRELLNVESITIFGLIEVILVKN